MALAVPARAQDEERTSRARVLFDEGTAAAAAGDWALAEERFRETHALRATPAVAYNLGLALVALDRLLEAMEFLSDADDDAHVGPAAAELIERARARLATVIIEVPSDGSWEVRLDGTPLPAGLLGVEVPVDPRACTLELLTPGGEVAATWRGELADGERRTVTLEAPPSPTPARSLGASDASPVPMNGDLVVCAVTAGTLTVLGVAAVAVAGWSWTDAESGVRAYSSAPTPLSFAEANTRADRTEVAGGVAAGTLAAAVLTWALTVQIATSTRPVSVSVGGDSTGAAVAVGARW